MSLRLPGDPAPPPDRVEPIQWLRGIAAMLVVFDHAALQALENDALLGGAWRSVLFEIAWLGGIGVDVFFVISGFVMAMTAQRFWGFSGAGRFLLLRFNRIAPLYYLLSLVLFADMIRASVAFGMDEVANTLTFVPIFNLDAYAWPIHYLGWTLAFEFVFYLVVAAFILARLPTRTAFLLAAVCVLPLVGYVFTGRWIAWQFLTSPMMWEFGFGIAAYIGYRKGVFGACASLWRHAGLLAAVGVVAAAFVAPGMIGFAANGFLEPAGATVRALGWGIPAFLMVAGMLAAGRAWPPTLAWLMRVVGDASYSIYLTHIFVVRLVLEAIQRDGLDVRLALLVVMLVSPFVGIATYHWLERPLMRRGTRVIAWLILRARPYKRRLRAMVYG
ncbi:MAG: acyltransferase family protein [Lautropia sp.]